MKQRKFWWVGLLGIFMLLLILNTFTCVFCTIASRDWRYELQNEWRKLVTTAEDGKGIVLGYALIYPDVATMPIFPLRERLVMAVRQSTFGQLQPVVHPPESGLLPEPPQVTASLAHIVVTSDLTNGSGAYTLRLKPGSYQVCLTDQGAIVTYPITVINCRFVEIRSGEKITQQISVSDRQMARYSTPG